MNEKQLVRQLEGNNGQCNCSGLEELFEKKNEGLTLQALCDSIRERQNQSEVLTGLPSRDIVSESQHALQQFRETVGEYHDLISALASEGKIKFKSHNYRYPNNSTELSYHEAIDYLMRNDTVVTLHCGSCDQQIDVKAYL